jgi:hypothetical protein
MRYRAEQENPHAIISWCEYLWVGLAMNWLDYREWRRELQNVASLGITSCNKVTKPANNLLTNAYMFATRRPDVIRAFFIELMMV